jgi:hypothetical protein
MHLGLNKVIRVLVASDFFLQAGWGLSAPIFAIFLTKQIQGGSIEMVGFVAATYWLTKSAIQPFIARFFDFKKGEKDDFTFLIGGMYVANLIPLGYVFTTQIWQIFVLEFIRGIAMACVIPSWSGIFTRHIDRGWEAFSWSIESTGIGLAAGISGALGGLMATMLGFKAVFVVVSFFGLLAATTLFLARKNLYSKNHFSSGLPVVPSNEKPLG